MFLNRVLLALGVTAVNWAGLSCSHWMPEHDQKHSNTFLIPLVGRYLPWLRMSHNIYMESHTNNYSFPLFPIFKGTLRYTLRHAYFWASPYIWTLEVQRELCVILLLAKWHWYSSSHLSTLGSNNKLLKSDCNRFQKTCIICIRIGY